MPFLPQTLESALAQNYPNLEVIVSENFSTDTTPSFLSSISDPRVRIIIPPKPLSMPENWQFAAESATGDFAMILGADDWILPEHIQYRVALHLEHKGLFLISASDYTNIDESNAFLEKKCLPFHGFIDSKTLLPHMFRWNMNITTIFFQLHTHARKSLYFNKQFPAMPDWRCWLDFVWKGGGAYFSNNDTVRYRIHSKSMTSTLGACQANWHYEKCLLIQDFLNTNPEVAPFLGVTAESIFRDLTEPTWLAAQRALRDGKWNLFLRLVRLYFQYHSPTELPPALFKFLSEKFARACY
jgi:glycosyltransferase involved in cell wall biosynthesis